MHAAPRPRLTRRGLLTTAGAPITAMTGLGAVDYTTVGTLRQDVIARTATGAPSVGAGRGTAFDVVASTARAAAGDLFLTDMDDADPAPLIADPSGTTLWAAGGQKSYAHCRLQTYRGQPVITWWESPTTGLSAYAAGRDIVTDLDHHVIATIALHDGVSPDEHEFFLTPSNTALIVSYVSTPMDLSALGGATDGSVLNGIFEEIDVATGQVLHHWESLDHVGLDESYADVPTGADEPYDYFHINSVKPTPDGEFLVSARHTWGIDKINPAGGGIRWRFGGKKTDFAIAHDARFAWQHDAQFEDATTLRMFDNGTDGTVTVTPQSQILWFRLDELATTTTLIRRFTHPEKVSAQAMGNARRLDNGNVMVGWGTAQRITEFDPDGTVVFDATLPGVTYRAYKSVLVVRGPIVRGRPPRARIHTE